MRPARPGPVLGLLVAAALCGFPSAAFAAGTALLHRPSIDEALDGGMPLAAKSAFLLLPPAARGSSPALPRLLRALAGAGRADEALALLEGTKPFFTEPVRSEAFLAEGTIHWERKDYEGASRAFQEVSPGTPSAAEAALFLARILAARGDPGAALRLLNAVPAGGRRSLLAGWIHAAKGDDAAAVAAWSGAPAGTPDRKSVV